MNDPLVSVIIPTYNRKELLKLAIESVLQQTYQNFELIVVDDGSTDGTQDLIDERYKNKLSYIRQDNRGVSVARNHGLTIAKGKYISYLDSDDIWMPEKIIKQVETIEKYNYKERIAVYSSAWIINVKGKVVKPKPSGRPAKLSGYDINDFISGPKILAPPSNLLIRSDILRKIEGFDENICYGEDWDLVIRLRNQGEIHYIDQPLFCHRRHPNSTQGIPKPEKIDKVLNDHLRVIKKNGYLVASQFHNILEKALAFEYLTASGWYFSYDLLEQGFEHLSQAISINKQLKEKQMLSQEMGYSLANGLMEQKRSAKVAEELFEQSIMPYIRAKWPKEFGVLDQQLLSGYFYHNLAFLACSTDIPAKLRYFLKSVKNRPSFIFTFGSLIARLNG